MFRASSAHHQESLTVHKFVKAKQAKEIYTYKNIKRKLYKINAAIWYNKTFRNKHLEPSYINIKNTETGGCMYSEGLLMMSA
jgi:hypothetical protein